MKMLPRRPCQAVLLLVVCCSAYAQTGNQKLFFEPPVYAGSGQTVTADFNADGKPDLISADGTVLLGSGDGTFTVGTPLSIGNLYNLIATGDFNGDGKPDMLVVSSTILYVLLGNGDGTFQPAIATNSGAGFTAIVVADFNGDGKLDVAGMVPGVGLLVFLGQGNGMFAPGVVTVLTNPTPPLLVVGDFTGDGKADIAFLSYTGSNSSALGPVGVLPGNGDGTFGAAITSSTTGVSSAVGLAAGDFNGDGKLDLIISGSTVTGSKLSKFSKFRAAGRREWHVPSPGYTDTGERPSGHCRPER